MDALDSDMGNFQPVHDYIIPRNQKIINGSLLAGLIRGTNVCLDPIHGHILLDNYIVAAMDTPQFQRLRDLKQVWAHSLLPLTLLTSLAPCTMYFPARLTTGPCGHHQ